jgi:hypothetical protein
MLNGNQLEKVGVGHSHLDLMYSGVFF